jgi:release factor glutamine methyltransferase
MSLKKVLLKIENKLIRFLNSLLKFTNYQILQKHVNFFIIEDFKYFSNKSSVGKTPQGEIAAKSIVKFIKEKKLLNLDLLDICCGTGIVGLTVFNLLKNTEYKLNSLTLADINIFNIDSIKKTLILNNYKKEKINCFLSDGLNNLDPSIKFDLIVSNPPHIEKKKQPLEYDDLSADDLGTYDNKWTFHENFYSICYKYLKSNGEIWFFENGVDATEDDFLKFINSTKKLNYYKKSIDYFDPSFFWMFSKLK